MIDEFTKLRGKMAEERIRKKVNDGIYKISYHAHERMAQREIPTEKVVECILEGTKIEDQVSKKLEDFKVLFQENNDGKPEIYTVVADKDIPVIVTVCRTKDEVWEYVDDVLKRRENIKK